MTSTGMLLFQGLWTGEWHRKEGSSWQPGTPVWGQGGNVKAEQSAGDGSWKLEGVLNQEDAHGGADCETEEDCLRGCTGG